MTKLYAFFLILSIGLISFPAWGETVRIGVIIGNNEGHSRSATLRYAEQDAKKMRTVLVERGGFRPANIRLLLGKSARDVWRVLEDVEKRLERLASSGEESALLFVYFSGHADGEVLELAETSIQFSNLKHFLKRSRAKARLMFIDACLSGSLVSNKAGKRTQGFEINLTDQLESSGYAIITSSAEDELSQESGAIKGSYFTHYLISGLRGAADQSKDGRITLNEAYQYTYSRTVARTTRTLGSGQHPMYDYRISGHGDVVLASIVRGTSGISVKMPFAGRLVILDQNREQMIAETSAAAGQTVVFGIPPGDYQVFALNRSRRTLATAAKVSSGQRTQVDDKQFRETRLSRSVAKGGLFKQHWMHAVGGGFVLRNWPLGEGLFSYGADISYKPVSPAGWYPCLHLMFTAAPDEGSSRDYWDLSGSVGGGKRWWLSAFAIGVEVQGGYEHLFQKNRDGGTNRSGGFLYLGRVTAEYVVANLSLFLNVGAGGRVYKLVGRGLVHSLDLQATIGLAWLFQKDSPGWIVPRG